MPELLTLFNLYLHAKNHLIHFIKIQKVVEFKYIWDKTKIQKFLPNNRKDLSFRFIDTKTIEIQP